MTNNHIKMLPTDLYYRGYRLSRVWVEDHWVFRCFFGPAHVDTFLSEDDARFTIDLWHNAA